MTPIPEDIQIGAAIGSVFFMLQNSNIPLWKRLVFCAIGFAASALTTNALVNYFSLGAGMSGGIGFFVAVTVIPLADTMINFAKNPASLVDLVLKIMGKGEGK